MKRSCIVVAMFIFGVVSLLAQDGTLDVTFSSDGKATAAVSSADDDFGQALAIQPDGKIVMAGVYFSGFSSHIGLLRLNKNGTPDTGFDGDGIVTVSIGTSGSSANGIALQDDGRIVVVGTAESGGRDVFAVLRFNSNGTPDASFDGDGIVLTPVQEKYDAGNTIVIQEDGKIVVGGKSYANSNMDFTLIRYLPNGSLDTTFDHDGIVTTPVSAGYDEIKSLALQTDGKIVSVGASYDEEKNKLSMVRYLPNGSLDTTFGNGGKVLESAATGGQYVNSVAIQPDGRIVVAGDADVTVNHDIIVYRYTENGILDKDFSGDGMVKMDFGTDDCYAQSVALQQDGKIVVVGHTFNGTDYDVAVLRLNSNGQFDTSFDGDAKVTVKTGTGGDYGKSVAIQPDGNIVIGGYATVGSKTDFAVIRLLSTVPTSVETLHASDHISFELLQNYPNPFNPSTTIGFTLQASGHTTLKIYDAVGREVVTLANENLEAGVYHQRTFDAAKLTSGVYFARLQSGRSNQIRKMLLMK